MKQFETIIFVGLLSCMSVMCQPRDPQYKVMFYNVENLFDTSDDPLTNDDDFTPAGNLHWTDNRYYSKLDRLGKVIIALGGWHPPDIIGLCEVENRAVVLDLISKTSLSAFNYEVVHHDSPDERGIDVALVYNHDKARLLQSRRISLSRGAHKTRDILYVKLILRSDTCHIFVNHWPSRSAGQIETEKHRIAAARTLKGVTDSLFSLNPHVNILIMGDFNDDPSDESMVKGLQAASVDSPPQPGKLYNLTRTPASGSVQGTLKYQGTWNSFDQILASGNLLSGEGIRIDENSYTIFYNSYLLEDDTRYHGKKPFRTYSGYRYLGGYSDHLPVYIHLTP